MERRTVEGAEGVEGADEPRMDERERERERGGMLRRVRRSATGERTSPQSESGTETRCCELGNHGLRMTP